MFPQFREEVRVAQKDKAVEVENSDGCKLQE